MKDVRVLILIPVCNLAGNGDGEDNSNKPKSKSASESYRQGWERIFAQASETHKKLNLN